MENLARLTMHSKARTSRGTSDRHRRRPVHDMKFRY